MSEHSNICIADIELRFNNENAANIELVDYTKSVPKVTYLHDAGFLLIF